MVCVIPMSNTTDQVTRLQTYNSLTREYSTTEFPHIVNTYNLRHKPQKSTRLEETDSRKTPITIPIKTRQPTPTIKSKTKVLPTHTASAKIRKHDRDRK
jgi:hypothetical protein